MTPKKEPELFEHLVVALFDVTGGRQDEILRNLGSKLHPELKRSLDTRIHEEVDE